MDYLSVREEQVVIGLSKGPDFLLATSRPVFFECGQLSRFDGTQCLFFDQLLRYFVLKIFQQACVALKLIKNRSSGSFEWKSAATIIGSVLFKIEGIRYSVCLCPLLFLIPILILPLRFKDDCVPVSLGRR